MPRSAVRRGRTTRSLPAWPRTITAPTSIGILGIAFWNAPYRPFYSMGRIQGSPEALEAERLWLDVNKATFGSDEHTRLWQELHLFWMNQQWFLDFGAINTYQAWQPWVKGKAA